MDIMASDVVLRMIALLFSVFEQRHVRSFSLLGLG